MSTNKFSDRLAVCSWSLQATNPADLIQRTRATGVARLQLALDPMREEPGVWGVAPRQLEQAGIEVVSGMFGCVGEDYTTLETIRATGGIAPDATWAQNWRNILSALDLAEGLGLKLVTFHAGFLPHDPADAAFGKLKDRLAQIAGEAGKRELQLGLETGQETAEALREFLQVLNHGTVGVNFDPANMLLYDKGDPIAAVRTLGPWIRQVHIKDANRTKAPGTWGEEVPAGKGQVDWPAFFAALREVQFTGNLCIEREAGAQRVEDIQAARLLVEQLAV
jgi:sugar phosphate isomerase/epimerase